VSLLAIAVCHSVILYLIYRYREQAHSYKGLCEIRRIKKAATLGLRLCRFRHPDQ